MLPRLFSQLIAQVCLPRRPFAGDDAVDHGVAQRTVRRDHVTTQDAAELCAEPLDATPALVVEKMRADLDREAIELFERLRQQHQLALGIDGAAPNALAMPAR